MGRMNNFNIIVCPELYRFSTCECSTIIRNTNIWKYISRKKLVVAFLYDKSLSKKRSVYQYIYYVRLLSLDIFYLLSQRDICLCVFDTHRTTRMDRIAHVLVHLIDVGINCILTLSIDLSKLGEQLADNNVVLLYNNTSRLCGGVITLEPHKAVLSTW